MSSSERLARARRYGFRAAAVPPAAYVAKPGSHDDGPEHGLFHGPVGGPAFSRDLTGRFSRWHLQPGMHTIADVDAAFLAVRWLTPDGPRFARLRRDEATSHEVAALHPMNHEVFTFDDAPFRVLLTTYTPAVPGDEELAGLPVVVFDVHVEPIESATLPAVDVLACWPNLNGWRASLVTTDARGDASWPGQHHAGNVNRPAAGAGVVQSRERVADEPQDVCGDVALVAGGTAGDYTRQVQFLLHPLETGVPDAEQLYTLDAVVAAFAETGRLGVTPDDSWQAHWHEPIGSAVAAHAEAGRPHLLARFAVAFDWPTVKFGAGRPWRRGAAAQPASDVAARALAEADDWLGRLDAWHTAALGELAGWSDEVAGCVVNELNLVTSLGTAWVRDAQAEHFGVLEGFDDGYFYYDTADLWHYAFPALALTWPRLADLVFADLGRTLDAAVETRRPVYRPAQPRQVLVADRMPHDLGCAAEDPFVRVNGYVMRDDPNTWRDLNPAYVLATLAHHRLTGRRPDDTTWQRLRTAAAAVAGDDAVPRHDEFGDSTWDNLGLRGHSTYVASLYAGLWAVLGDHERLRAAQDVLGELWNGTHFRAASEGKYTEAVMPDSLMGVFYADVCGAGDVLPRERIANHLRTAYEYAFAGYRGGTVGPLLVAEEQLRRYERDGGQELQVNEVLLGSGWLFTAMLAHYGLRDEAAAVAGALRNTLYGGTGLQFRTPAAVDGEGRFRAPLNMRPLAAWWLLAVTKGSA
ncbi:MAG: hypothetical protein GEV07_09130 [Streptosporangiales bacterium]|nr:hypothetical protein [Streptosporangiales bacterium]